MDKKKTINRRKKLAMSKTQYAYEYISTKILDGVYGPGQRIIIDQIAKELGTSTIPIREAIRNLESDGLIQYKPYSGAIVSAINETEYIEILSVISVLEGYAAALSARKFSSQDIEELQQLNTQMHEALEDFQLDLFNQLNRKFHSIIYEKCENDFLLEEIRQSQQRLDRIRSSIFTLVPGRTRQSIEEHNTIIHLLKEKAPLFQIEEEIRQHRINTIIAFKEQMKLRS
ncbi:GntR family transcriptional regulator [Schinkia azotoformans]|uniref:GntR family transcriptional regulator n=1 Tax=Schinkia azotoformans TaxID=1454 RepID=UPI002DC0066D|nr:GntR family transcriptional regulator [Schinkia azotoformans]MEC1770445.1 GntR family transcriptional regulator [Schinkia azotoformans]MED4366622.1 GntR family transcriptional regulator [Schinkia azotoformans]